MARAAQGSFNRRAFLKLGAGASAAIAAPTVLSIPLRAQGGTQTVTYQLGWLASGNQLGEVAAKRLGYYEAEKIDLKIQPGGPSIDGVAVVAAGRTDIGQVSSSPSIMLAISQDLPIKCFATGAQQHPFTYFSLKKAPIKTPQDMIGKKIGMQATAQILFRALLAKHKIDPKQVQVIVIGADMTPLMTGQVDAITGWQTNTTALRVVGDQRVDLRLWDAGVQLYALPFYAQTKTLETKAEMVNAFIRATAKGWAYAAANKEKAVELLIKEYPNFNLKDELEAADVMLSYVFNANTKANGWGAMDPAVWESQIKLYSDLGQFSKRTPAVNEVMTLANLKATDAARPRIG
jgi:NitT/TauT family transport system substrate-binding protein